MSYRPITYCNTCGEAFDVYREPGNRRCDECVDKLVEGYGRAKLGIDGNAAFALLGPDIQEGEAEFVTIPDDMAEHCHPPGEVSAQLICCRMAFLKLRERLGRPDLSYYLDRSHPYGS